MGQNNTLRGPRAVYPNDGSLKSWHFAAMLPLSHMQTLLCIPVISCHTVKCSYDFSCTFLAPFIWNGVRRLQILIVGKKNLIVVTVICFNDSDVPGQLMIKNDSLPDSSATSL